MPFPNIFAIYFPYLCQIKFIPFKIKEKKKKPIKHYNRHKKRDEILQNLRIKTRKCATKLSKFNFIIAL